MKLIISNKPYSPWPMRVWVLMKELGIEFEEEAIDLSASDKAARLKAVSPTGRVPVLVDGDILVWDSMAIVEYLHDIDPAAGVWPADAAARAHARAIAAEMHSGFTGLRGRLIMNTRRAPKGLDMAEPVLADIRRIAEIWIETRKQFGKDGPFLYGKFSAADAVFAPIVSRFWSYAVDVPAEAKAYMDTIRELPSYMQWIAEAETDPWHNSATDSL